jgi:hypothetical protein
MNQLLTLLNDLSHTLTAVSLFAIAYFATGTLCNVARFVDSCKRAGSGKGETK